VPALGHTRCSTGQARKIITTSTAHAQVRALRDKCRDYNLQAAPCSIYRITLIHGPEITADTSSCSHNLFTNYKQNQATRYKPPHNRVQGGSSGILLPLLLTQHTRIVNALHHRHLARGPGRAISLRALQGVESRTATGSACWRRRCYRRRAAASRVEASGVGEDGEGELLL